MRVIKYSGKKEEFDSKKIYDTVLDAGGSEELANKTRQEVEKRYHENITTAEILEFILKFLKKYPGVGERYNLKHAIMSLGPSGFPFEVFFAKLLEHYGYKTKVGQRFQGDQKLYEIDIVAKKKTTYMIECKYHNKPGIVTKLRHAEYTQKRFLELKKHGFDQAWLSTNTKSGKGTLEYVKSVNMKFTGWKYPAKESLRDLIENKKLYPITILIYLPKKVKIKLYEADILIAKDLLTYDLKKLKQITGLGSKEVQGILQEVRDTIGG
jgi:hypothetical protein